MISGCHLDQEVAHVVIEEQNNDTSDGGNSIVADQTEWASSPFFSKFTWLEISGACGDFGNLIPLMVALSRDKKIHLTPTLLLTGVLHICNGLYWDVPMPLQPMHMISAQALGDSLTGPTQVAVAGVGMGFSFVILQCVGGLECLHRIIPRSVIGGLQLGVGWKVAFKGIGMIQSLPWWGTLDCIGMAIILSLLTVYALRESTTEASRNESLQRMALADPSTSGSHCFRSACRQIPIGILLFFIGIILASIELLHSDDSHTQDEMMTVSPFIVDTLRNATTDDWYRGLLDGTLPQLPLTILNSCLSVCLLAESLFPQNDVSPTRPPLSRKSVGWSIALMNLLFCPLGMAPHCHGAGGLAGQVRLGARTGASMVALGLFKMALGIVAWQGTLLVLLDALPVSVLGILLAVAGHELALTGIKSVTTHLVSSRSRSTTTDIGVALVTALVTVSTGMAHIGVLSGWLTSIVQTSDSTIAMSEADNERSDDERNVRDHPDGNRIEYSAVTPSFECEEESLAL